jgi:DNA-directed RNA polymerase
MPPTLEDRFKRQIKKEEEDNANSYRKVVRSDHENKVKSYGSHTSFGNIIRREMVGYVAEAIAKKFNDYKNKGVGKGAVTILHLFSRESRHLWSRTSHIAVSSLLDKILWDSDSCGSVHQFIGQRIEDDMELRYYKGLNRDLFDFCESRYMSSTAGYRQKMTSTRDVFKKNIKEEFDADQLWRKWSTHEHRVVGSWLTALINQTFKAVTNLEFLEEQAVAGGGRGNAKYIYRLTEPMWEIELAQQIASGKYANYLDNPMVCPPIPWRVDGYGGFILNEVDEKYPLVRGIHGTVPSETALACLNDHLQRIEWQINPFVLEQMEYFFNRGESINDSDPFKPFLHKPEDVPQLPPDLLNVVESDLTPHQLREHKKELKTAKKLLRAFHNEEAARRKNAFVHIRAISCARRFVKEDRFWMPWSFDFRTRMYPICILNPQSGNHINALLRFANPKPLDEHTHKWLAIHVATTKGFSKETFDGRVEWVKANHHEIEMVATDPLRRGRSYWAEADEPWTYLAACREYWEIYMDKSKTTTNIPCGIDATASGLQILGALVSDSKTCDLVNVLPTDRPSDLYTEILNKVTALIRQGRNRQRIPLDKLSRSITKAPTMTLAYGSTEWRRKRQVLDACNSKRKLNLGLKWKQIEFLAKKVDDAICFVLPGVTFTLDWLKKTAVAAMAIDPDKKMLTWTTPAGSLVKQEYYKTKMKR